MTRERKNAWSKDQAFYFLTRGRLSPIGLGHILEREIMLAQVGHQADLIDALHGAVGRFDLDCTIQFRHEDV